jgi:PAS domain S-box-containing protein
MHPLRILLLVSVVVALAVALAFGYTLERASAAHAILPLSQAEIVAVAGGTFLAFLVPWAAVFFWAVRRARDIDRLIDRAAALARGGDSEPADASPFHAELGELSRAIEETRDVIVRQRQSFDEQRAAMHEIVASLGEGLLALGPKGRIVFANAKVGELFGTRGELVGRSFLEVVRRQPLVSAFDRALHGEASRDRTGVVVGGRERQIEIRVFPVAASAEIAAIALFIDITEIERLQRIRRDFLDDFSHEVRTPLAGLRAAVETREQGHVTPEQEEQLRRIMTRAVGRIERLVEYLSELNRIESGELRLDRQPLDLMRILGELIDEFRERGAGGSRIVLRGEPAWAMADSLRVQQIFTNLIDNAIKHGGGRGEIVVEVGDAAAEAEAVVRISDEGEGIPPQELERIFHRFYRVDRSRSQNVPGLGLGLAITKHLVLQHGGSIRACNRDGGGATFEVRLPR